MFLPNGVKIYLCTTPMDMRRSFWGLCGAARDELNLDPSSGALFVFINRRQDMVKILWREGDGFAIWSKRLDKGCFRVAFSEASGSVEFSIADLSILLKKITSNN